MIGRGSLDLADRVQLQRILLEAADVANQILAAEGVKPRVNTTTVREFKTAIAEVLRGDRGALRARAEGTPWSPLEYACHTRDVLFTLRDRIVVAMNEEEAEAEVRHVATAFARAVTTRLRAERSRASPPLAATMRISSARAGDTSSAWRLAVACAYAGT